ncbi:hypothetical protein [Reyranella sp.]
MTKDIRETADALGIVIHDHRVPGCKGRASFRVFELL